MGLFDIIEDIVDFGSEVVYDGLISASQGSSRKSSNRKPQTKPQNNLQRSNRSASSNTPEKEETQSVIVEKAHDSQEKSNTNSSMREQEKLTPAKELLKSLQQLRKEEDRVIEDIKQNGRNVVANVANFFAPPKSTKVWNVAKTLAGKSKDEKLAEARINFDEKKAQLFDRTMTPADSTELWEMFMTTTEVYRQTGLGEREKVACKNLLTKLIETCDYLFIEDSGKMALINNAKKKYLD